MQRNQDRIIIIVHFFYGWENKKAKGKEPKPLNLTSGSRKEGDPRQDLENAWSPPLQKGVCRGIGKRTTSYFTRLTLRFQKLEKEEASLIFVGLLVLGLWRIGDGPLNIAFWSNLDKAHWSLCMRFAKRSFIIIIKSGDRDHFKQKH